MLTGRSLLLARLKGLDGEITAASLRLHLSRLNSERAHIQHIFDDFVAIKHLIRSLPDDILHSIFLVLINQAFRRNRSHRFLSDHDSCVEEIQSIWTITHVSNRWRQVAIGFPKLWSIVRLTERHFTVYTWRDDGLPQGIVKRLACQLERSASHPLHISVSAYDYISTEGDRLIQLLLPTCSRWLTLELHIPLNSFQAFRPIQASLPLLEGLDITAHFDGSPADVGATIGHSALSDLFSTTPRLSSIARDPEIIPFCTVPWGQITTYNEVHVNISQPMIRNDLATLKRMPSLRLCSLVCYTLHTDTSPTVNLPEVEELRLIGDAACVTSLLPRLILPSLTRLSLFISSGKLPIDKMTSVLSRFATIQHLAINEDGFPAVHTPLPFVTALPRLESFYVRNPQVITAELFAPLAAASVLAPSLKALLFGPELAHQAGLAAEAMKRLVFGPELVHQADLLAGAFQQMEVYHPELLVTLNVRISSYFSHFGWLLTDDSA